MTDILVLVPALISVLGATLLYVFRFAFLMILVRTLLSILGLALRVILGLALPLVGLLALRGILGVTLVQVLVPATLLITRRTVWLIMLLPHYVTLLLFLPKLLQESRRQSQGSQKQERIKENLHCTCYSGVQKYNPH